MASTYGASRSHSLDKPNSIGLPWSSDQPDAETSAWERTTFTSDRHPCPRGFRIHTAIKRAALGRAATGIRSWNSNVQNSGSRLKMKFWIVRNTVVTEMRGRTICTCLKKHCWDSYKLFRERYLYWRKRDMCLKGTAWKKTQSSLAVRKKKVLLGPYFPLLYNLAVMNCQPVRHQSNPPPPPPKKNQDKQCKFKSNTEPGSRNHCRRGEAINVTYSECICILAPIMRQAKRIRRVILSSVACLFVEYFSTLSEKRRIFRKNVIEHKVCVFIFCTIVGNVSRSKKNWPRYYHKYIYRSSRKVPVILVRL